jgi:hypothetical protein
MKLSGPRAFWPVLTVVAVVVAPFFAAIIICDVVWWSGGRSFVEPLGTWSWWSGGRRGRSSAESVRVRRRAVDLLHTWRCNTQPSYMDACVQASLGSLHGGVDASKPARDVCICNLICCILIRLACLLVCT